MKKRKKLYSLGKHEELYSLGQYEEHPIDDFIKELRNVKRSFEKDGYTNFTVDVKDEWGYYDEHNVYFVVRGQKRIKKKKNESKRTKI